jgi:kumamolisin
MSDPQGMIAIPGSNRPVVPEAKVLGKSDSTQKIRVSIYARRNPHLPEATGPSLEQLSYSLPGERKYPDEKEFSARFGAESE